MNRVEVLDHGFVELIDFMGDDYRVLQSARVSTGGEAKKGDIQDERLIEYLFVNEHLSPFEQCVFTFRAKMPNFVAKQFLRHRTFSFNEYSQRYSEAINDFFIPENFRKQGKTNHQGSGEFFDESENMMFSDIYEETLSSVFNVYEGLLEDGVSRELARGVLPSAQYTDLYFTVDLRNLFHFLSLRLHDHAQYEIKVYAEAILEIIKSIDSFKWSVSIFERINLLNYAIKDVTNKARKYENGLEKFLEYIKEYKGEGLV